MSQPRDERQDEGSRMSARTGRHRAGRLNHPLMREQASWKVGCFPRSRQATADRRLARGRTLASIATLKR
jgi:hypothetical protein